MLIANRKDVDILTEWCRNKPEDAACDIMWLHRESAEFMAEVSKHVEEMIALLSGELREDDVERALSCLWQWKSSLEAAHAARPTITDQ